MLLSIIIPIYNVEKYISQTLNSIYSQLTDFSNIEIIMINDGSTDNSISIAEEYYNNYKSCTYIIHQENMGLSCARNTGLKVAKGKYIWFIDSDDTVSQNSIDKILKLITEYNADILAFDMIRVNESSGKNKVQSLFYRKYNKRLYEKTLNKYQLVSKIRETPVQKFLFKNDFLKRNRLVFYPGILHEDNEYMVKCIYHAESIIPIQYAPYKYLIRSNGSITSSNNPQRIKDLLKITDILNAYKNNHTTRNKEKAFFDYYRFFIIHRLLKNNLFKEYKYHIRFDKKKSREIIMEGLIASIKLNLWGSVVKCLIDLYKNRS